MHSNHEYSHYTILSPDQAAAYLGVKPKTLSNWRSAHVGPVYSKIGKLVKYRQLDLDEFVAANARKPTR